jgi:mono/diheme cytochrome c family protein
MRIVHRSIGTRLRGIAVTAVAAVACHLSPASAGDVADGKALLEKNCSRCHAVAAGLESPLKAAPNLWTVLGYYPAERLEVEMGEGIGSRHPTMPQIQFSDDEIASIYAYLHSDAPEAEQRRPQ